LSGALVLASFPTGERALDSGRAIGEEEGEPPEEERVEVDVEERRRAVARWKAGAQHEARDTPRHGL